MKLTFNDEKNNIFLGLAEKMRAHSHDASTQVGCILVNKSEQIYSIGANRFPDGVEHIQTRPAKYSLIAHAEEVALAIAGRNGIPTNDTIAYVSLLPCAPCARNLIIHGISEVIFMPPPAGYKSDCIKTDDVYKLLNESGIIYKEMELKPYEMPELIKLNTENLVIASSIYGSNFSNLETIFKTR